MNKAQHEKWLRKQGLLPSQIKEKKKGQQEEVKIRQSTLDMTVPENILHLDEVENWDDHMNSANYSAQQRSFIKQVNEKKDYAM